GPASNSAASPLRSCAPPIAAQHSTQDRPRIEPGAPIAWAGGDVQGGAPATIEPAHLDMLPAIDDGGNEAAAPKQAGGRGPELSGAVHDAPPLVRRASISERNEGCARAWAGASATTGAAASTVGAGSTGRAIRFRRGGGSGNGVAMTCSIVQSGTWSRPT